MSEEPSVTLDDPIRVGTSACLLGEEVRFDGGHKRSRFVTDTLAPYVEFVPVCPELEAGMGVPREPVRLVESGDELRMVGTRSEKDWTSTLTRFSRVRVRRDDLKGLSGYILKSASPSCGMERVKVYGKGNIPRKSGVGLFAAALAEQHPLLPVEEEGRLNDAVLREAFIVRVFAYHRLQRLFAGRYRRADLVDFHARHKYLLLAHSEKDARELGRVVARVKELGAAETRRRYSEGFMRALGHRATRRKHTNVLMHILGFLRDHLDGRARQEVLGSIQDYRAGLVPLVAPMTLLEHYVRVHDVHWVRDQHYLNPHPKELMLRNHV